MNNHINRMKGDIEAFKKAMGDEYPIAQGLEDLKQPADLKVFVRGNPYAFGEDAPRGFLAVLSDFRSRCSAPIHCLLAYPVDARRRS